MVMLQSHRWRPRWGKNSPDYCKNRCRECNSSTCIYTHTRAVVCFPSCCRIALFASAPPNRISRGAVVCPSVSQRSLLFFRLPEDEQRVWRARFVTLHSVCVCLYVSTCVTRLRRHGENYYLHRRSFVTIGGPSRIARISYSSPERFQFRFSTRFAGNARRKCVL